MLSAIVGHLLLGLDTNVQISKKTSPLCVISVILVPIFGDLRHDFFFHRRVAKDPGFPCKIKAQAQTVYWKPVEHVCCDPIWVSLLFRNRHACVRCAAAVLSMCVSAEVEHSVASQSLDGSSTVFVLLSHVQQLRSEEVKGGESWKRQDVCHPHLVISASR